MMKNLKGESGQSEVLAFICDVFILIIFVWNQIRYGMNMSFLIIPLIAIGLYLFLYGIVPEEYCFLHDKLEIRHRFRKTQAILYDTVFNYEATKKDSFIGIGQSNRVKLYYENNGKKTVVVCRPVDVDSFVELIKKNCPEFHEYPGSNSKLDIFFTDEREGNNSSYNGHG